MDDDVETGPACVEGGLFHAVVERQARNVYFVCPMVAQHPLQLGAFKARVTLQVGCPARVYDRVDLLSIEARIKLCSLAALHTVDRPGPSVCPERLMVRRVPVSRCYHESCLAGEAVDRLDDGFAVRYGECPAGAKVVLDIDDDQRIDRASHGARI